MGTLNKVTSGFTGWDKFFEQVLKDAPTPVMHEGVQGNIHPDANGNLVWHVSVAKVAESQTQKLIDFVTEHVGEGEVTNYEGGSVMKVIHVLRPLTDEEKRGISPDLQQMVELQAHYKR
jgi:hypothetical protein